MPTPPAAGELARVEIFSGVLGRGGPSSAVSALSALDALETCCAFGVHGLMVLIEECGHHCAGRSVPGHVHEPLADESHYAPARDTGRWPGQRLPRPARQPLAVGGDALSPALQLLVRRVTQPRCTPDA
jgi:hypothetical protein